MGERGVDARRLIEKRREFVDTLSDQPARKRELVDKLDCSRSTVDRAIDELQRAGWVRKHEGRYESTLSGRLAAESHRRHASAIEGLTDHAALLDQVPVGTDIDPTVFTDATVTATGDESPYRVLDPIRELIDGADIVLAAVPRIADPQLFETIEDAAEGAETTLVVGDAVTEYADERVWMSLAGTARVGGTVVVADALQLVTVVLVRRAGQWTTGIALHDTSGGVCGTVVNTTGQARGWALTRIEEGVTAARPLEADAGRAPDSITIGAADDDQSFDRTQVTPTNGGHEGVQAPSDAVAAVNRFTAFGGGQPDTDEETGPMVSPAWDAYGPSLETEGFVHLSPAYFDNRRTTPAATAFWTGVDFTAVAAGYALDRRTTRGDEGVSLTDDLVEGLLNTADQALVGPPGSGKSTVLRTVAYRWYESGQGPVFYRPSGGHQPFVSTGELAAALEHTDGHVLVVVEDAIRPEANAVFELMTEFSDNDGVTFLVDARDDEWEEGSDLGVRQETYRQSILDIVRMPPLDGYEVERFLSHVKALVDDDLPGYDSGDLLTAIRSSEVEDAPAPGEVVLLFHRIAQHLDAPGDDDTIPTTLVEDVRKAYEEVRSDSTASVDATTDVAVTINLLNAADVSITWDLLLTLGLRTDAYGVDDVRTAVETLTGTVVFDPDEVPMRTVHDTWSVEFLETLLDDEGAVGANLLIGRCIRTILALAEDADLRSAVRRHQRGECRAVDAAADDPEAWIDDIVERVFAIGRDNPSLAPIYGRTDQSTIDDGLPDNRSDRIAEECIRWRAEIYLRSGDLDMAESEYDALTLRADDVEDETRATELRAVSLERRGYIASQRGDIGRSNDLTERALDHYRAIDDAGGKADGLRTLGVNEWTRGNLDRATDQLTEARERYQEVGDHRGEADCLTDLGAIAWTRGELATAAQNFSASLDIREAVDDPAGVVDTLIHLGIVARDAGDYERAEELFRRALDRARDYGGNEHVAHSEHALGDLLRRCGDTEAARRYVESALDGYRETENTEGVARSHRALGAIDRIDGDPDAAEDTIRTALESYRDIDDCKDGALAIRDLGIVALERGDLQAARRHLTAALHQLDSVGRVPGQAEAHVHLGRVERSAGDLEGARSHFASALDRYQDIGAIPYALAVLDDIIDLCRESDEQELGDAYQGIRDDLAEDGDSFPERYEPF